MPSFTIPSEFDDDITCEFVINRKTGAPFKFTVPLLDYLPLDQADRFDKWIADRSAEKDLSGIADDLSPEDREKAIAEAPVKTITDREVVLKMVEIAGVGQQKVDFLAKQPNGVLDRIWKQWQEASRLSLGEFAASPAT